MAVQTEKIETVYVDSNNSDENDGGTKTTMENKLRAKA